MNILKRNFKITAALITSLIILVNSAGISFIHRHCVISGNHFISLSYPAEYETNNEVNFFNGKSSGESNKSMISNGCCSADEFFLRLSTVTLQNDVLLLKLIAGKYVQQSNFNNTPFNKITSPNFEFNKSSYLTGLSRLYLAINILRI